MTLLLKRVINRSKRFLSIHCERKPVLIRPAFPIVSFTFDDFPRTALSEGGVVLEQVGGHATYYVSMGLMDQSLPAGRSFSQEDLRRAVVGGHELGCHTYGHCHAWNTRPAVFAAGIVANGEALQRCLPNATFETLSYPIAHPRPATKRQAGKYFLCCRGGGETFNSGLADATNLSAVFLERRRDDLPGVKAMVDEAVRRNGWLIFATHDVCHTPSPFGCSVSFFREVVLHTAASGAKILPIAEAWRNIRLT